MAGTFETIDADGIDAGAFGTQCVADGDTLVDDPDAGAFQSGPMIRRFRTRGFNKLDAAFDDGIDVLGVRRRREDRKRVVKGKSVSVSVNLGGGRYIKKKKKT